MRLECDLPPGYARSTANKPWEDGSLPIGALDLSLVAPGPLIYVEAGVRYKGQTDRAQKIKLLHWASPRYKGQTLSFSGFADALASSVQMGLAVESSMASGTGVTAALRARSGGPEMLGWAADAVARALVSVRAHRGSADPSALRSRAGVVSDRRAVAHNEPRPRRCEAGARRVEQCSLRRPPSRQRPWPEAGALSCQ